MPSGHVTAADDWDEPARRKAVRPSLPGAYEHLMHTAAAGGAKAGGGVAGGGAGGAKAGPGDVFVLDLHSPELADALTVRVRVRSSARSSVVINIRRTLMKCMRRRVAA